MKHDLVLLFLLGIIVFCLGAMAGVILSNGSITKQCDINGSFNSINECQYLCEKAKIKYEEFKLDNN
jgi:hypothetical protein